MIDFYAFCDTMELINKCSKISITSDVNLGMQTITFVIPIVIL